MSDENDAARQGSVSQRRLVPIYVMPSTRERFERFREETRNEYVPEMTPDSYLATLLDTHEAVNRGYYTDE